MTLSEYIKRLQILEVEVGHLQVMTNSMGSIRQVPEPRRETLAIRRGRESKIRIMQTWDKTHEPGEEVIII